VQQRFESELCGFFAEEKTIDPGITIPFELKDVFCLERRGRCITVEIKKGVPHYQSNFALRDFIDALAKFIANQDLLFAVKMSFGPHNQNRFDQQAMEGQMIDLSLRIEMERNYSTAKAAVRWSLGTNFGTNAVTSTPVLVVVEQPADDSNIDVAPPEVAGCHLRILDEHLVLVIGAEANRLSLQEAFVYFGELMNYLRQSDIKDIRSIELPADLDAGVKMALDHFLAELKKNGISVPGQEVMPRAKLSAVN
jgi:hypothetical protein